jgi:hypothetical protein
MRLWNSIENYRKIYKFRSSKRKMGERWTVDGGEDRWTVDSGRWTVKTERESRRWGERETGEMDALPSPKSIPLDRISRRIESSRYLSTPSGYQATGTPVII